MLENFSKIAKDNGIQIEACAESGDWTKYGILPSKCIDGEIFEKLLTEKYHNLGLTFKGKTIKLMDKEKSGCMPVVDVGRCDTCNHKCNYCYARKNKHSSMYDIPLGEVYERKTELEFEIV